jgi:hypothetical protein
VKSIILKTPEVRSLLDTGTVQVRRAIAIRHLPVLPTELSDILGCDGQTMTYRYRVCLRGRRSVYDTAQWPIVAMCPFGQPGGVLWVRETWAYVHECGHYNHLHGKDVKAIYRADDGCIPERWRPSVHMPRWAARLMPVVEAVRVEMAEAWEWVVGLRRVV